MDRLQGVVLLRRNSVSRGLLILRSGVHDPLTSDKALDFETTPWRNRLVLDWSISRLRSPRPRIRLQEVENLHQEIRSTQKSVSESVHPKSVGRARKRDRNRRDL